VTTVLSGERSRPAALRLCGEESHEVLVAVSSSDHLHDNLMGGGIGSGTLYRRPASRPSSKSLRSRWPGECPP